MAESGHYLLLEAHRTLDLLRNEEQTSNNCIIQVKRNGDYVSLNVKKIADDSSEITMNFPLNNGFGSFGSAIGSVIFNNAKFPADGSMHTSAHGMDLTMNSTVDIRKVQTNVDIQIDQGKMKTLLIGQRFIDRCMPGYPCMSHHPKLSAYVCKFE